MDWMNRSVWGFSEKEHYFYLDPKNWKSNREKNLSPIASAHAIAITGTLTRTLDRQTKQEKLCSVEVG